MWWRERKDCELEREIAEVKRLLHKVVNLFNAILMAVSTNNLPASLQITQEDTNMITGITAGMSGTFQESFLPVGSVLPKGATFTATWSSDDANVSLAPSADGTTVVATVAATDTAASFNLTVTLQSDALKSATNPTGVITSGPVNVPIIPAPVLPTSLAINQIA